MAIDKKLVRTESDRKEFPRARNSNTGGIRLKLQVFGVIDGYHLYWENDEDAAIEQLMSEGWEFVEPHEVNMQSHIVSDSDVTNRISKYVGKKSDGSPLRAFLMKCPNDLWSDIQDMKHEQADIWDNAIKDGSVANVEGRYNPTGLSINLKTSDKIS